MGMSRRQAVQAALKALNPDWSGSFPDIVNAVQSWLDATRYAPDLEWTKDTYDSKGMTVSTQNYLWDMLREEKLKQKEGQGMAKKAAAEIEMGKATSLAEAIREAISVEGPETTPHIKTYVLETYKKNKAIMDSANNQNSWNSTLSAERKKFGGGKNIKRKTQSVSQITSNKANATKNKTLRPKIKKQPGVGPVGWQERPDEVEEKIVKLVIQVGGIEEAKKMVEKVGKDPGAVLLLSTLDLSLEEVQAKIDKVAGWADVPKGEEN